MLVSTTVLRVVHGVRTLDEDVLLAQLWHRCLLIELERVEAILAFDSPLPHGCWCHGGSIKKSRVIRREERDGSSIKSTSEVVMAFSPRESRHLYVNV